MIPSVSSRKAVGVAPLVAGFLLAGQSFERSVLSNPSPGSIAGLVGGCAAILVGIGILSGWREFGPETDTPARKASLALAGISLLCFAGGVALAVV
jgi:hypothetical protein